MKSLFPCFFSCVCIYTLRCSGFRRFTRLFGSHHAIAKLDFLVKGLTGDCQRMASSWLQSTRQETQDRRDWRDWLILKCVKNMNHRRSQSETRYKKRMKRYKLYKLALRDILSILSRCHVRFWSSRLWRHPGRALLWQQTFEALQAKASEIHEIHKNSVDWPRIRR